MLSLPERKDLSTLDEIVQSCLDLYCLHLKRFKAEPSACDGHVFVYNRFSEFAFLAYFDNRPEQRLDTSYFYRFSSTCRRASRSEVPERTRAPPRTKERLSVALLLRLAL